MRLLGPVIVLLSATGVYLVEETTIQGHGPGAALRPSVYCVGRKGIWPDEEDTNDCRHA
ncbi:MAG: hypothetical protein MRJ92_02715 [Nitrospira sp.]|nr:hypothetical protein [Nitrospira sp.]